MEKLGLLYISSHCSYYYMIPQGQIRSAQFTQSLHGCYGQFIYLRLLSMLLYVFYCYIT